MVDYPSRRSSALTERQRIGASVVVLLAVVGALWVVSSVLDIHWHRGPRGDHGGPHGGRDGGSRVRKAVVVLKGKTVSGTVTFSQPDHAGPVTVSGKVSGLEPNALRGFHVHEWGDVSSGCAAAGAHFNPQNKEHGAPGDDNRHVGDLGNIESDSHGVVELNIVDHKISLNGFQNILGRSIVVHSGTDDTGRGGNPASKQNGNAGGRDACGIIAVVD